MPTIYNGPPWKHPKCSLAGMWGEQAGVHRYLRILLSHSKTAADTHITTHGPQRFSDPDSERHTLPGSIAGAQARGCQGPEEWGADSEGNEGLFRESGTVPHLGLGGGYLVAGICQNSQHRRAQWCTPVISVLRRQRQEDCKPEANLGYLVRACLQRRRRMMDQNHHFSKRTPCPRRSLGNALSWTDSWHSDILKTPSTKSKTKVH
jgi:hypothetical protein